MNYQLLNKKTYIILGFVISFFIGIGGSYVILSVNVEEEEEEWLLPWEIEEEVNVSEVENGQTPPILIVDIKGEIHHPGIYSVSEGDRVFDAILLAGGFTSEANEKSLNLAEKVYDEMVIYVPSLSEAIEGISYNQSLTTTKNDEKVNVNQASAQDLTVLPGIGPAKAEAIVKYRDEFGPFKSIEELVNVPGIGEKTLENIEDSIAIP